MPCPIAIQSRELRRVLPLKTTYDATLATMGPHTRRNLRSVHRHVVKELGASYLPQAELSRIDFLNLNRVCTYTVPDWVAQLRYDAACSGDGTVFAGLRAADGHWLSLLGGRRNRDTTFVDWQMNLQSSGPLSLGTAMRAFFLADEIHRGMLFIRFEGGTPHSIQNAFVPERVTDLLFARRWLSPVFLRTISPLLPEAGLLADTLRSKRLVWRRDL